LKLVLDSIQTSLADSTGCIREVVCPECLAHYNPSKAEIWNLEEVLVAKTTGNTFIRCSKGHLVDTYLLCGAYDVFPRPPPEDFTLPHLRKPISKLLGAVVLVGLWDTRNKEIFSVGSGFLVEKKLGLVVTAGHVLFDMGAGQRFGTPYFGRCTKVVIGIIPNGSEKAVFRYFSELVVHNIWNIDACILRITTRMRIDVDDVTLINNHEVPLKNIEDEKLEQLEMTISYELEETVRILGFNQGGEGVFEKGEHINQSLDFAKGYICRKFMINDCHNTSTSSGDSSSSTVCLSNTTSFIPRQEIVVICPTICGHSGGPCINDEGKVVGILSRADPTDRQRCYLVPTSEIKLLMSKAKKLIKTC